MIYNYNYNIQQVDETAKTMLVEYTKEGSSSHTIAMRLPFEDENLLDYLSSRAPIINWTIENELNTKEYVSPDISLYSGELTFSDEPVNENFATDAINEVYANVPLINSYASNILENTFYKGIYLQKYYNMNNDFIAYDAFAVGASGMRSGLKIFPKAKELGIPIFTTTTIEEVVTYATTHLGCQKVELSDGYKLLYLPWNDDMVNARNLTLEEEIREKRNQLLIETDYWQLPGNEITTEQQNYRQELRDITSQETFPQQVVWPTKP